LVAVPLTWLSPLAFLLAPWRSWYLTQRSRAYLFCLVAFAVCATVTGLVGLGVYGATMRYLSDITFGLVLLSLLGAFALRTHARVAPDRGAARTVSLLVGALAAASIVIGMLVGYQGYNAHFHRYNPKLDRKLTKALSFCGGVPPSLPKWMDDKQDD
jgi:uncharacterized membrane protein YfcA